MAGNRNPPPIEHPIIDTELGGLPTVPWTLFFDGIFRGDQGMNWTPVFTNLTQTGGPASFVGRIYQISSSLAFWRVVVTPATNTSATAGTTYITGFPLNVLADGICFALAGGSGSNSGVFSAATQRIFVPTWTNVTLPVTVIGIAEVR